MVLFRALLCALAAQVSLAILPTDASIRDGLLRQHLASHGQNETEPEAKPTRQTTYPSWVTQRRDVQLVINAISQDRMRGDMETLTGFHNRHYQSETGVAAAEWVFDKIKRYAGTFKITKKRHSWPQRSIDVQISEGLGYKRKDKRVVIVGAHLDSINTENGKNNSVTAKAPGADDNASSVAVLLEALYLLLRDPRPKHFRNQVHFHFYAAEEVGLQGSSDIFEQYSKDGYDVVAFLNQDMSGYKAKEGPDLFTVITDYVYAPLNEFVAKIIKQYTNLDFKESKCGYSCSDHASAFVRGFPAALVTHSRVNEDKSHIHTVNDTLDEINYEHMAEHVKLILGFVFELGFAEFGPAETTTELKTEEVTGVVANDREN